MTRFFDPVVQRFIEAIRLALPRATDRDVYWAYHFLSGALTLTFAETGRIDKLSGGACKSSDFASVHERLVPFCRGGISRALRRWPCAQAARDEVAPAKSRLRSEVSLRSESR